MSLSQFSDKNRVATSVCLLLTGQLTGCATCAGACALHNHSLLAGAIVIYVAKKITTACSLPMVGRLVSATTSLSTETE